MEALVTRALAEHLGNTRATDAELAEAEARIGFPLPRELRMLYRAANGIRFWESGDYPCRLVSAAELDPVHVAMSADEPGPPGLFALLQAESDFVALDLDPASRTFGKLIDCSHETYPFELHGVCDSLTELLALVLDSQGREWIWTAARAYGVDYAE